MSFQTPLTTKIEATVDENFEQNFCLGTGNIIRGKPGRETNGQKRWNRVALHQIIKLT